MSDEEDLQPVKVFKASSTESSQFYDRKISSMQRRIGSSKLQRAKEAQNEFLRIKKGGLRAALSSSEDDSEEEDDEDDEDDEVLKDTSNTKDEKNDMDDFIADSDEEIKHYDSEDSLEKNILKKKSSKTSSVKTLLESDDEFDESKETSNDMIATKSNPNVDEEKKGKKRKRKEKREKNRAHKNDTDSDDSIVVSDDQGDSHSLYYQVNALLDDDEDDIFISKVNHS